MAERSIFDRLVHTLDSAERRDLLDRIQRSLVLSTEPLQVEREEPPAADVEEELQRLKPFQSLWLFLKAVCTGKNRRTLVKEALLRKLAGRLERQCRGLADFRAGLFLNRMYEELAALRDCASLFREPLHQALVSRKHDFFAFLAGMVLAETRQRLALETDPFTLQDSFLPDDESDIRQEMFSRFESILEAIPGEDRNRMYLEARTLHALHGLSAQPFDAMLACFAPLPGVPGQACEFFRLKRYLPALGDALLEANYPPSPEGLRALFLFFNRDSLEGADFDLGERLLRYFGQTEEALAGIRGFNARIPLPGLVRVASGNLGYVPRPAGGGEDWLALLREFWRRRLEESWQACLRSRLREQLSADLRQLTGLEELPELNRYGPGARHALSAIVLQAFRQALLPRIHRPLRLIHLQGEFYKPGNRREFSDSIKRLERVGSGLEELDPELPVADQQVLVQVQEAEELLESLIRLLGGILHGEPAAPYDTLVNLATLGGSENRKLINSWREALDLLSRLLELLQSVKDLERAADRQTAADREIG